MADVLEDSKDKVQENLLANGGKKCYLYSGQFSGFAVAFSADLILLLNVKYLEFKVNMAMLWLAAKSFQKRNKLQKWELVSDTC